MREETGGGNKNRTEKEVEDLMLKEGISNKIDEGTKRQNEKEKRQKVERKRERENISRLRRKRRQKIESEDKGENKSVPCKTGPCKS